MSPSIIRNIVNYVAYPEVDQTTKRIKNILYFVDTEIAKQRKLIADLDRETYLNFLENDYSKRMIEEYGDELGLFGQAATSPKTEGKIGGSNENISEGQKLLDSYLNN